MEKSNLTVKALDVAPNKKPSNYPKPFASRVSGRTKRQLGDVFGLKNFGVNLTILEVGAQSSLLHRHRVQDEFIYILEGNPTLVTDLGEVEMTAGDCAGFPAKGHAHHLINRTDKPVLYIEIGDRTKGEVGEYPNDDLAVEMDEAGNWVFSHKDGTPY